MGDTGEYFVKECRAPDELNFACDATATTPVSSLAGNGFNAPSSPWIDGSARAPQTPRVGATPQLGRHGRKSSTGGVFPPSPTSKWSSWFGGGRQASGSRKDRDGHLPTFGKRANATPPRPFYSEGAGRRGTVNPLILARNIVLRPFYLLGRRGPLLPILASVTFILLYLTYSTSPSSQSVKLRVQGAVGPYIPQRAADAIRWRGPGLKQAPLGADNLLGGAGGVGEKPVPRKAAPLKPEELPPVGIDSRIKLEEGKPHPIPGLMAQARQKWEDLKSSQSRTFAQAVEEYKRRHGRNPPKGFDRWCVLPPIRASWC